MSPVNTNLMRPIVLALFLLLLLDARCVSSHDLEGGCLLANFTRFQKQMKALLNQPQVLRFHGYQTYHPVQGLHLALEGISGLRISWMNPVSPGKGKFNPVCRYGTRGSTRHAVKGVFYTYSAGMFSHTLNSAVVDLRIIPCLNSTAPCVRALTYQCGDSAYGFSDVMHVNIHDKVVPSKPGPKMAVVGDMGMPHGLHTVDSIAARLSANASDKGVQMLLHAGDISYADHFDTKTHNNSYVWVDYMNSLQAVASRVPYMTAPGNHEAQFQFAAYLNWLPMPFNTSGSNSPFWFSFDYMGVHIVSFSTEHDFRPNSTQHRWIQQDLQKANRNRGEVPWVIAMGHRPLYCSSLVCYGRCHKEAFLYRGYLEQLLYDNHVDVVIAGHNHQYERSYPVYRSKATQKDYINPQAPVYIVNGAAGNPELNDPTFEPFVEWRAWFKVTMNTGFLLLTPSKSQLTFEYVMSDTDDIIDTFTISRQ